MQITININTTTTEAQPALTDDDLIKLDEFFASLDDDDYLDVDPTDIAPSSNGFPSGGVYMTLEEFAWGREGRAFGPDDDVRWVAINSFGQLYEQPYSPATVPPLRTIAVVYYGA